MYLILEREREREKIGMHGVEVLAERQGFSHPTSVSTERWEYTVALP